MFRQVFSLSISITILSVCAAQTVQVNPDGTHTVIFNQGSTSTQVNPDGTHTVIFNHGSTSTQVNPDGTHTQVFHHGSTSTQVNPDGSHSTIFHNGSTSTRVNPDGSHTIIFNDGTSSTQVNPDGIHTLITNDSELASPPFSRVEDSNETVDLRMVNDTMKTDQISSSSKEYVKLKSLLEQQAIDSTDFSILILRILNNIYDYNNRTANQIDDLKHSLDIDSISAEEYILQKNQLIYGKERK